MMKSSWILIGLLSILISACAVEPSAFDILGSEQTHLDFENSIPDSDVINILSFEYIYNGGGVGTADFDKDGLQDLFFTGNFVDNALFLNKGNFLFEDISESSGIRAKGKWCTGVSVVDINSDSWPDIYISVNSFNTNEVPNNLLYIHQGLNQKGLPYFKEAAREFGIQGGKHSMHAAFFDYDLDGDLDLYLLNNVLDLVSPTDYRPKQVDGDAPNNDQFFINNGDGTFSDFSKEAGIVIEGYGLGLAVTDMNKDGYPDIFVANDYITNDLLYINQKDGTFKNEIDHRLHKQSKFSMGVAASDFDSDGERDFLVLDMLAEENYRLKKLNPGSNYNNPVLNKKYNYQEQNVRNMLHMNIGNGQFLEQAFNAGVFASDWSWTPLCEDFDLDGDVDIYVTNGFPKDVTDLDFIAYKANRSIAFNRSAILDEIPEVKISNKLFQNNGNNQYSDMTIESGLHLPSFSNGAIAVDLDNDGDKDIVTNNINLPASIIRNNASAERSFQILFSEELLQSQVIGSKIFIHTNKSKRYLEYFPHQSYLSSASSIFAIGLENDEEMDSLVVIYPDKKKEVITNFDLDYDVVLKKENTDQAIMRAETAHIPILDTITLPVADYLSFDANIQSTIPYDVSHFGPKMIEIPEGILVCAGHNEFPYLIKEGKAKIWDIHPNLKGVTDGIKIDLDSDGEMDLLFTKASYRNNSKGESGLICLLNKSGKYQYDADCFSDLEGQFLALAANDFDKDGDMDLFLGSNYIPGQYPQHLPHYLAINQSSESSKFDFLLDEVKHPFAINDAKWADCNGDGFDDLHLTGHWQGIASFINEGGKVNTNQAQQIFKSGNGLWNTMHFSDLNGDGIDDLIIGNQGTNTPFLEGPVELYAADFDQNGTIDPIAFFNFNNKGTLVPLDLKDEIISQLPGLKKQFPDYESYTKADINSFFQTDEREKAIHLKAEVMKTKVFLSSPSGFGEGSLPEEIQLAPVFVIDEVAQFTFFGGNASFGKEFWGSTNASYGNLITFNGNDGELVKNKLPYIKGDLRDIVQIENQLYISRCDNSILTLKIQNEL